MLRQCQLSMQYLLHLGVQRIGEIRAEEAASRIAVILLQHFEQIKFCRKFIMHKAVALAQQKVEFTDRVVAASLYLQAVRKGLAWTPYDSVQGSPNWAVINAKCPPLPVDPFSDYQPPVAG